MLQIKMFEKIKQIPLQRCNPKLIKDKVSINSFYNAQLSNQSNNQFTFEITEQINIENKL